MTKQLTGVITLMIALAVVAYSAGLHQGQKRHEAAPVVPCTTDAACEDLDREYARVVSAIARTMRCSTEEEHAQGLDHECDPSEVEEDAGLVDAEGQVIR